MSRLRSPRALVALCASLITVAVFSVPSAAVLDGGTFDSANGNFTPSGSATTDWGVSPPNLVAQNDTPSGSNDNAFGQGSKEDIPNPTVVYGSIPPNKSDLTRFLTAHTQSGTGHQLVYLAWERSNVLGSANMDFEFNQNKCDANDLSHSSCNGNGVTPSRRAGDILITFDFVNGGGTPVLGLLRWVTTGSKSQCFSANAVPCWGNRVNLSAAGFADGAVNSATVTDTTASPSISLPALTFGEAGIDLSAAGVFDSSTCTTFGSAFLKSRSSASFTAELKDFIAPAHVTISNCGSVSIHKQDDTGAALSGVVFTLWSDADSSDGDSAHDASTDTETSYTCTTGASGDCTIDNVAFGTYWVVETTGLTGYTTAADQSVVVAASGSTPSSLTFVDARQPASIVLHKQDDASPANPLAGATFTLWHDTDATDGDTEHDAATDTASSYSCTSVANGDCTIDQIFDAGAYWIVESGVPAGYDGAADRHQVVALGDSINLTAIPFVDQALFKVVTFVCKKSDNSLVSAAVGYDEAAPTTANSATTPPAGTTAALLCGLSGSGDVNRGAHTTNVTIP
jgi:hypothetical protein